MANMMRKSGIGRILFGTALIWCGVATISTPSRAQTTIQTIPAPATTANGNQSGTITTSNTFQKVFGATAVGGPFRHGCEIQNNGAANMWVSEGKSAATAAETSSHVVAAGGVWYCDRNDVALQGEVDITGTATQAFYAVQY